MKHVSALFVAICFCSLIQAQQKISLGFKGGINIPGLGINSSDPVVSGYKTVLSPYYGVVLECGLNKRWSIMEELNYANTTITKNGNQVIPQSAFLNYGITNPSNQTLYADFYSKIQLKYLEAPIMLKYYIYQKDKINFFVNGGVFGGILLYAHVSPSGFSKVWTNEAHTKPFTQFGIAFNTPQNIVDWLNPVNFGLQGGAGFTYKSGFGELFAQLSTNHGLIKIQENPGDGNNNTQSLALAVGYLFHLSK